MFPKNSQFSHTFLIFSSIIFSVMFFGSIGVSRAEASAKPASTKLTRIFYYVDNEEARLSLFQHPDSIDILAPQAYSIDDKGNLTGSLNPAVTEFVQKKNIKVMPLVTNAGFDKISVALFLDDQAAQALAIQSLISEAQKQKFYGWQLDFEQINLTYRDKYSAFVQKAGQAFKKANLVLSVAVVSKISDIPSDYPKTLWDDLIGAYDYASLASSTDFISIMSYDDPVSKGPVARYSWLKKVIDYGLQFIPASKLSLGIPMYYWKWNDATGKLVGIGGYAGIKNTLDTRKVTLGYSTAEQAPFLKYKVGKNHYTLWYENAKSIAKKISLINQNGLQGFSAWVLGLETPSVYSVF
ncbi:MAG: glycosyl hydrolase family 18 protein [Candidatus Pacebacteria bacterium]|nr:glycosyl hydrolase family 18 protein [Candidatus Paceibacterota bacterium]